MLLRKISINAVILFFISFFGCDSPTHLHSKQGIISLSPAISSLLITLGREDRIIGAVKEDFFVSSSIDRVGSMIQFSLEKILLLKPQVIVYQDFQKEWLRPLFRYEKTIQFIELKISDMASIFQSALLLCDTLGLEKKKIEEIQNQITQYQPTQKFSYIGIVERDEEGKQIFVFGQKSYLTEILTLLGGKNQIAIEKDYFLLHIEALLKQKKIDCIIDFSIPEKKPLRYLDNVPYISISDKKITIPDLNIEYKLKVIEEKIQSVLQKRRTDS